MEAALGTVITQYLYCADRRAARLVPRPFVSTVHVLHVGDVAHLDFLHIGESEVADVLDMNSFTDDLGGRQRVHEVDPGPSAHGKFYFQIISGLVRRPRNAENLGRRQRQVHPYPIDTQGCAGLESAPSVGDGELGMYNWDG